MTSPRRSLVVFAMVGAALVSTGDAEASLPRSGGVALASLTLSEASQIRQFIAAAQTVTAPRLRALVARPDLSLDESAAALSDALAPQVFNETRSAFLHEVVFGGASRASRSVLAAAVTRGVLARADALYERTKGDLDANADAAAELQRIYAFLASDLATPGQRRGLGPDPQSGIALSTYEDGARAIVSHIDKHPKLLQTAAAVSPATAKVRAQAQLAMIDFMNDGPTFRIDAADRLALTGARRSFFTELGILVLGAGKADDARIDSVRRVLARLPGGRGDASAIYFGDAKPALKARGSIIAVKSPLEAKKVSLFTDEVEAATVDGAVADFALELANAAVRRALGHRAELRAQVERDVRQVRGDKKKLLGSAEANPESALAATVQLLVLDAQRTIDSAFSRFHSGSPESAAILADAIGVLAAVSPNAPLPAGPSLPVGRIDAVAAGVGGGGVRAVGGVGGGTGAGGASASSGGAGASSGGAGVSSGGAGAAGETTFATAVQLAPNGSAIGFTLDGHKWDLSRGDSGVITSVQRDGAAVNALALVTARAPGARVASATATTKVVTSQATAEEKTVKALDKGAAVGAKSEKSPR